MIIAYMVVIAMSIFIINLPIKCKITACKEFHSQCLPGPPGENRCRQIQNPGPAQSFCIWVLLREVHVILTFPPVPSHEELFEAGLNMFCSAPVGSLSPKLLFSYPPGGCSCMHFSLPLFTPKHHHSTLDFGFFPSNFGFHLTSHPGVKAKRCSKRVIENGC